MTIFFIQDLYSITGIGVIPVGQVKSGTLKIGMKLKLNGKIMEIKSIEMHHNHIKEAKEGDNVAIILDNADLNTLTNHIRKSVEFV